MKSEKVECILLSGVDERVTKSDAETICAFHEGWLVDMDEGRGDCCKLIWLNNRNIGFGILVINIMIIIISKYAAGPQKNNLIKSLISAVDPHVPQIPGMQ